MNKPKLLDTVAILKSIPVEQLTLVERESITVDRLPIGLIGVVVETYERDAENFYLVEFSDSEGCEYAIALLKSDDLLVVHYELSEVEPNLVSSR